VKSYETITFLNANLLMERTSQNNSRFPFLTKISQISTSVFHKPHKFVCIFYINIITFVYI
jgi:hypothetical protein